jgi:hypothetical protein
MLTVLSAVIALVTFIFCWTVIDILVSFVQRLTFRYRVVKKMLTSAEKAVWRTASEASDTNAVVLPRTRLLDVLALNGGTWRQRQRHIGRFNAVYVESVVCEPAGMTPKAVLVMEDGGYGKRAQRNRLKVIRRLCRRAKLPVVLVPKVAYHDVKEMVVLLSAINETTIQGPVGI